MTILRTGSTSGRTRASGLLTVAAGVLVWLVAAPSHPTARVRSDAPQAVVPRGASFVCMGSDGTLSAPNGVECGPKQAALLLDSSEAMGCSGDPWHPESSTAASTTSDDASSIMDRLVVLENAPLFEVVDKRGQPIFMVLPCEVALANEQGEWVTVLKAEDNGGVLSEESTNGEEISIGASGDDGGVLMTDDSGERRVEFGKRPAGNYSLLFSVPKSGPKAAIGESQAGTGALIVGDKFGRPEALMSFVDGKGRFTMQDAAGAPLLALTEGESQAGMLVIGDSSSEPMVKFSVTNNRYGAVLAGPVAGFPTVPGSGLPGSYILGCAGGAGCGPGGGGRRR